jgi:hypothetical protein
MDPDKEHGLWMNFKLISQGLPMEPDKFQYCAVKL